MSTEIAGLLRAATGAAAAGSPRPGRSFLKNARSALAFGMSSQAASDDIAIILAATAEALAVTFYYAALIGAAFEIGEEVAKQLKLVMDAETQHL